MFFSSRTSRPLAVVVTAAVLPLMPSPPLRSGAGLSQHCAPDSRLLRCALELLIAPPPASAATATGDLSCDYWFHAWNGGFVADLTITNHGPAVDGWAARWTMRTATGNLNVWQARMEQPDPFTMTATNLPYNAVIGTGRSVRFGWTAVAASTEAPADITVNGTPC